MKIRLEITVRVTNGFCAIDSDVYLKRGEIEENGLGGVWVWLESFDPYST